MKTKRLSLLLAFIMILSVFSGTFVVNAETLATYPELTATDKAEIAKGNEWKIGDTYYADWPAAATAAAAATEATTVYLLADTTEELPYANTEFSPAASITVTGVTQENESKPTVTVNGYRWISLLTAQSLTVQNIEIIGGDYGAFQTNAGSLTLVDVDIASTVDSIAFGIIVLTAGTDLVMTDSTITSSSDLQNGAIYTSEGSDVTLNGSTITLRHSVAGGNTHWSAIYAKSNTHKINITNSTIDISEVSGYRIIYAGGSQSGIEVTLNNSVLIGAPYSYDIMQAGSGSTVTVGDNVLLVGGGDRGSGMIFRNVAIEDASGTDVSDTYRSHTNDIDITTSIETDKTNAALIAQLQTRLGNVTKDKLATMLGYRFRTAATEDAAYADGAFTGYIKELTDSNTGTLYQLGSYYHTSGSNWKYTADTSIIGINNPVFHVTPRLFGTDGSHLTLQNLSLKIVQATSAAVADDPATTDKNEAKDAVKGGTFFRMYGANDQLTLDNVDLTFNHFNYGLIETKDTVTNGVINIINSNITAVTGGYASNDQNLVHASGKVTINVTNSIINLINGNGTGKLSNGSNGSVILTNSVVKTDSNDNNIKTLKGSNVINGYTVTAPASGVAYNANLLGNEMLYGSAVRVVKGANDTDLTDSGLRFMSTVTPAAITAAGENATFGTVIFRYNDYTAWMAENEGKTIADFIAAASESTHKVVDIEANTGIVGNATTGYTILAALVNIRSHNYTTDFGAVAYIKTADGTIVYSEFNTTDNVRNIVDVSIKALADTTAEKSEEKDINGFKHNVAVNAGEVYYVKNGNTYTKKTAESNGEVYSPYTADQRKLLNKYIDDSQQ